MQKNYISLGLMSGTSGDGVDASIIKSNRSINMKSFVTVIMNMILQSIKIYTL